ncbi:MAG TPA: S8 family serine peptidase, partial [Actinomycetota bacterium]|nr:S8 family serine peptidase [Actinomycetota bacterium]
VAAGNDFVLSSGYADEPTLVVSATDRRDAKPSYSSGVGGARWGIAAPGGAGGTAPREDDVFSTYPDGYAYMAGTSMAAPHVAGAVALLRSAGLSPQRTVDRLLSTAKDIGPPGRDSTFGAGRLNAGAALRGLGSVGKSSGNSSERAGAPGALSPSLGSAPLQVQPEQPSAPSVAAPVAVPTTPPPPQAPGVGAGRDLPADDPADGLPMAVWVTGLVTILLAVVIGWALFRPNPPD